MSTLEQALAAKSILKGQLSKPKWLRGIGISRDDSMTPGDYVVKVNVFEMTDEISASIPFEINGVMVLTEEVGDIVPL
jgi:hypothetical protein